MPAVMITGARAPIALDLARRFHRAGWRVHLADSVPAHASAHSRAVATRHRLPPPRQAPQAFARALAELARRHRIELLLPTCEEIFHLARQRAALPSQLRVLAAEAQVLRALHSKADCLALARRCAAGAIGVPDSACVDGIDQAREWAQGRAVVLKPEFSRFGSQVRLFPQGLGPAAAELAVGHGRWLVQALVQGRECCSYAVAERGRLLAHAAYAPRHRLVRGSGYYFDPLPLPAARGFAERLVAQLDFSGQIAFDWIVDAAGLPWLLECNPRGTSGVHLFAADDPLPAALAGQAVAAFEPGHRRAAMLAAPMWLDALPRALAQGTLPAWRADLARADDVLAVPGDRAPLAWAVLDTLGFAGRAVRQRCGLRQATTFDLEWDGEQD